MVCLLGPNLNLDTDGRSLARPQNKRHSRASGFVQEGGCVRDDQTQANGKFWYKRTLTVSGLNVRLWSSIA